MKLKVKDMNGKVFEISDAGCDEPKLGDAKMSDEELSAAEIKKLKKLIPHLDELLTILESESKDDEKDFDADELEVDGEETEKEDESVTVEESVEDDADFEETDEEVKVVRDSKASFGSISRKPAAVAEDEIAKDEDIAATWAKYYGGK